MSRTRAIRRWGRPAECVGPERKPLRLRGFGLAPRLLAWALLALRPPRAALRAFGRLLAPALGAVGLAAGCLPPDFEIEPAENHQVTINKALLTISPDQYQDLSDCQPRTFDVTNAIVDPDAKDPKTIAWLVNYPPNQHVEPDANNRLRFTYDPCRNPKSVEGKVSTIEVFVLDRVVPLDILADADELKAFTGDNVTTDSVVWFVGIDSFTCCP